MLDVVSAEAESAFEDVLKRIASEIADVGVVVDGGAACVEAKLAVFDGLEFLNAVCQ
jgi:hypothetical protein